MWPRQTFRVQHKGHQLSPGSAGQRHCAYAQDDELRTYPKISLALTAQREVSPVIPERIASSARRGHRCMNSGTPACTHRPAGALQCHEFNQAPKQRAAKSQGRVREGSSKEIAHFKSPCQSRQRATGSARNHQKAAR